MNLFFALVFIFILFILLQIILNVEKKYLKYKKGFNYNDKKINNELLSLADLQDKLFRLILNLNKKYQKYSKEIKYEEIYHKNILPSLSILKEKTLRKKNSLITKFKKLYKNDPLLSFLTIIPLGSIFLFGVFVLLFNLTNSQKGTYISNYDERGNKITTKILAKPKQQKQINPNKLSGVELEFYNQKNPKKNTINLLKKRAEKLYNSAQYQYKYTTRYLLKKVSLNKYILLKVSPSVVTKYYFERFVILGKNDDGYEYSNRNLLDPDKRMRYQTKFSLNKWTIDGYFQHYRKECLKYYSPNKCPKNRYFQITTKNKELILWTKDKDGKIKKELLGFKRSSNKFIKLKKNFLEP